MSEPRMQSPLQHFGLPSLATAMDDSRGVWANELPLLGYISLRGDGGDPAFVAAASRALGLRLPTAPCSYAEAGSLKVLWLSPDEWMIVCERGLLGGLLHALDHALAGIRSQVADNSGGYAQVLLLGREAQSVLSHTSVYDFAALAEGWVVGTTFGKSSVYVHRDGQGFCLLFRRSFADYIWRFLVRAAQPYGFGVARLERPVVTPPREAVEAARSAELVV